MVIIGRSRLVLAPSSARRSSSQCRFDQSGAHCLGVPIPTALGSDLRLMVFILIILFLIVELHGLPG
jgi:uncharacterized membrane protein